VSCKTCYGKGILTKNITCPKCEGKGQIRADI
jgi:DnaJ-class molecular chaperone